MQIDMHYYGVYILARCAGMKREICEKIATASQFVDENAFNDNFKLIDGAEMHTVATAHHALSIKNIVSRDEREVWVPFHFLPGNQGNTYHDKLVCKKNSEIAQKILKLPLNYLKSDFVIQLIGIISHVYADTFSHCGFSGISIKSNQVDQKSIKLNIQQTILEKIKETKEKIIAELSEISSLGHGAVYTYPDLPFLNWSFKYENDNNEIKKDNPSIYLEACEGLYNYYSVIANNYPEITDRSPVDFNEIKAEIIQIINHNDDLDGRIAKWINFIDNEKTPIFQNWNESVDIYKKMDSSQIIKEDIYKFFQAAEIYRTYVLRELLPANHLVLV